MRYRLPEDCVGVSLEGSTLRQVAKGVVEADAGDVERLAPHGIVPADDQAAGPSAAEPSKKRTKP